MSLSKQEPNKTNKTIGERGKRGRKRGRKWRRRNKKKKKRVDQPLPVWPLVNSGDGKRNGNHIFPVHVFPSHSFGWSIDKFFFFLMLTSIQQIPSKTITRQHQKRTRSPIEGSVAEIATVGSETSAREFQWRPRLEPAISKESGNPRNQSWN